MIALPDPAMIVHDHLEALGEDGNLVAPKGAVTTQTGEEEDREASPMPLVVKLTIADRNARHAVRIRSNRGGAPYAEVPSSCQTPRDDEQTCTLRIRQRPRPGLRASVETEPRRSPVAAPGLRFSLQCDDNRWFKIGASYYKI
jgi:hypothetical protein